MRKIILKKAVGNGLSFVFNSLVIAAWYYLVTQKNEPEASAPVMIALSIAGLINLLDLGSSLFTLNLLTQPDRNDQWSSREIVFSTLVGCLTLEVLIGGAGASIWKIFSQSNYSWADIFCIVAFAASTQTLLTAASVFRGLFDFAKANYLTMATSVFVYGVACILLMMKIAPISVFYVMTAFQAVCAGCSIWLMANHEKLNNDAEKSNRQTEQSLRCFLHIVRRSIYFFPQIFAGIFFLHIQRFVIFSYLGSAYIGNYSFAYALATRLHAVLNSFFDLLFPYAKQFVGDDKSVLKFGVKVGSIAALLCLFSSGVLACAVWVFAPKVMEPYIYYVIGVVFAMFMAPAFHILNGIGGTRFVSACSLLTPVIFLTVVGTAGALGFAHMDAVIPLAYCASMLVLLAMLIIVLRKMDRQRFIVKKIV